MNTSTSTTEKSTGASSFTSSSTLVAIASWVIALWASKVFLSSLPYKFSSHPDTQHIFGTIGDWLGGLITPVLGDLFTQFGAYLVGTFELITAA
ncbi:MAG: hypothetical protein AB8B79_07060, partial [Granulosicoccus sp.]